MIITSPPTPVFKRDQSALVQNLLQLSWCTKAGCSFLLPVEKTFAALNPDRLMVFTAESQFWCLSDTALGLVLQSDSPLAAPLSFFWKAKLTLVIKEGDTAGTEALTP